MQVLVVTHSRDPIDRALAAIARRATPVRLDVDRLATDAGFTMVQEASGSRATARTAAGAVP
ncbi:MAG TPA: hypothetical protein PKA64_17850, partial [Myxococcota bacterium]|nr:hypothetical protein [Myxococcota bacterium]